MVDAIVTRASGHNAVVWSRADGGSGHRHGVSLLATFARWARQEEVMSADDQAKHERRAAAQTEARVKFGGAVAQAISTSA